MFTNKFISLCDDFVSKREDILFKNIEDSKKICRYRIELFSYILEFRYVKKESVYIKPSSLYCVIGLKKNSVLYYHLTDIIPFLERKSFKSCYFWNIESEQRLINCFESLISAVEGVVSQIAPFLLDGTALEECIFESYRKIFDLKDGDIDFKKIDDKNDFSYEYFQLMQNYRDGYIFSRFSVFVPYALLLENKKEKALKKYEKFNQKGKLLEYEKQLLDYIDRLKDEKFIAFDSCSDNLAVFKEFSAFGAQIKAFALVFVVASVFFCSFFAIYNLICSINTLVLLSAPWYLGCLCAGLCSVFGAIAFFPYIPSKHITKAERKNISKVVISKAVKKFSFIAFALSVVVSCFFAVMIIISNVRFYDESIKFDDKVYSYSQIDSIYYIEARYNEYGDRIERPSYVVLFDDKASIDLDGSTSVKYTEQKVLPLLKEKTGLEIKIADSERQLPWYSKY